MRSSDAPVLIVGAGPAGLTAAMTLSLHGIPSLLVDRRDGSSELPRATFLSTRSMELLRAWGLEHEVRAGGVDVAWHGWTCESLAQARDGVPFPLGLPSPEQSAIASPTGPACVPQDQLEPVLLRHLDGLGQCTVRWNAELAELRDGHDGVEALLRDTRTGESAAVRARYAVGADGAHSAVRRELGIPMHGADRLADCATALFHAPLWPIVGDLRYGIYDITDPDGGGVLVPAGRDRWLYGLVRPPGALPARERTAEALGRRIRAAIGAPGVEPLIERTGEFTFAAQVAERFRGRSTFLVGDAAHRVTPRGGTGLNTAIHDGYDLGWKLAWVLAGWARPELLASYEGDRRPVVEHNVARSAEPPGTGRDAGVELHADLGGRIAHVWLRPGLSTLDLLGPGLTLLTGPDADAWDAAAAAVPGPLPLTTRALDVMGARALGVGRRGAVVVRPDGVPLALCATDEDAAACARAGAKDLVGSQELAAVA